MLYCAASNVEDETHFFVYIKHPCRIASAPFVNGYIFAEGERAGLVFFKVISAVKNLVEIFRDFCGKLEGVGNFFRKIGNRACDARKLLGEISFDIYSDAERNKAERAARDFGLCENTAELFTFVYNIVDPFYFAVIKKRMPD